jgi:hypothetical protein
MLTGGLPFTVADPMEWVHCHLAKRPVEPAERLMKEIPGAVSAIVMKMLAKRTEDRYQTAARLESNLRRCLIEWEARQQIDDSTERTEANGSRCAGAVDLPVDHRRSWRSAVGRGE